MNFWLIIIVQLTFQEPCYVPTCTPKVEEELGVKYYYDDNVESVIFSNVVFNNNHSSIYLKNPGHINGGLFEEYSNSQGSWFHKGIDYRARSPFPVYTPIPGEVIGTGGDYGKVVIYNAKLNVMLNFQHLSSIAVSEGCYVNTGDFVGLTGTEGATLYHLHVGLRPCHSTPHLGPRNFCKLTNFDPPILLNYYPFYTVNDHLQMFIGSSESSRELRVRLEFPAKVIENRVYGYSLLGINGDSISSTRLINQEGVQIQLEMVDNSFKDVTEYLDPAINTEYRVYEFKLKVSGNDLRNFESYDLAFEIENNESVTLPIIEKKKVYTVGDFHDIPDTAWYRGYVKTFVEEGFLKGFPDGSFRGAENINKGELAKISALAAYKAKTLEIDQSFKCISGQTGCAVSCAKLFDDVDLDNDFFLYIQSLRNENKISGDAQNKFYPSSEITRGQLARMLVNIFELPPASNSDRSSRLTDIDGSPDKVFIERIVDLSRPYVLLGEEYLYFIPVAEPILSGTSDRMFEPNKLVERAEALKAVLNCFYFVRYRQSQPNGSKAVRAAESVSQSQILGNNFEQTSSVISNPPIPLTFEGGSRSMLMSENESVSFSHPDIFDEDNDRLFFYWSSSDGQLSSSDPNLQSATFDPPNINRPSVVKLYTLSGDHNGNIAEGLFDIQVIPSCISMANFLEEVGQWRSSDNTTILDLIPITSALVGNLEPFGYSDLFGSWVSEKQNIEGENVQNAYYRFELLDLYPAGSDSETEVKGRIRVNHGFSSPCGLLDSGVEVDFVGHISLEDKLLTVSPIESVQDSDQCTTGGGGQYSVGSNLNQGSSFNFAIHQDENCNLYLSLDNCAWSEDGTCISGYRPFILQDEHPPSISNVQSEGCTISFDIDDDHSAMSGLTVETSFNEIDFTCTSQWTTPDSVFSGVNTVCQGNLGPCPGFYVLFSSTSSGLSLSFEKEAGIPFLPDFVNLRVIDGSGNSTSTRLEIPSWCLGQCGGSGFD